ncbi:MAG: sensor domain-containing diguanylate cyclase [Candidatus Omnitrophica bacterium]|nr:sensor domain-containing diguanylate cyclase [Candidatus Omnitrophota bacterium]
MRLQILAIIIFFLLLGGILPLEALLAKNQISSVLAQIIIFYLTIPLVFIWLSAESVMAVLVTVFAAIYLLLIFKSPICFIPVISLFLAGVLGYTLRKNLKKIVRKLQIKKENEEEFLNILNEDIKNTKGANQRMQGTLGKLNRLKNVIEDYSRVLSEGEVLDAIIDKIESLFDSATRILLYRVDTQKQELILRRSKKINIKYPIRAKKGDIFDKHVFRTRQPILVGNIHSDFRFSLEEEKLDGGFSSLIAVPLSIENKIIGILRVDSNQRSAFSQSDLRFLDIIADLSSVALENSILYEKVKDFAIHDSLTGLFVHSYFKERLRDETGRSLRSGAEFSLIMLDLDDFKKFNDQYGHRVGDLILKHVTSTLKAFFKKEAVICRYGGEEFAVILPHCDKDEALKLAENLRKKIESSPLTIRKKTIKIAASIGIASLPLEAKTPNELLVLVDSRLYKAKEKGKNRVWAE